MAAGLPIFAEENIEGYTYTDLNGGADYFALRVEGDSMDAARIFDGCLVIVRKQDIVEDGQIAVVLVDHEDATIKRFHREGDTVILSPQSTNPAHKPLVYNLRETKIKIEGKIAEVKLFPE